LNCIALPDGRPIWGGTYFPKEQWPHYLNTVAGLYRDNRRKTVEYAEQLNQGIIQTSLASGPAENKSITPKEFNAVLKNIIDDIDQEYWNMPPSFYIAKGLICHIVFKNLGEITNRTILKRFLLSFFGPVRQKRFFAKHRPAIPIGSHLFHHPNFLIQNTTTQIYQTPFLKFREFT
jgi:hypothetical protein